MTQPAPAPRRWKRFILRLVGSALVLTLLLRFVPLRDVAAALRRVPTWAWALALVSYLLMHLIGIVKWRLLINTAGAGLTFGQTARCYYYGLFGNLFLPSIVGGDVVRAGLAMSMTKSVSGLLLGSLADRTLDIAGLAGVAGIGALLLPTALDERSRSIFVGVGLLFLIAAAAGLVVLRAIPARRFPYRLRRRMVAIRAALRALASRPGRVVSSAVLGMLLQTLLVVLNAMLGDVVGIHISFVVWLFVWPLAKIAAVAPLTQNGIGVREAAIVALFQPFHVTAVNAMATGLVFTGVVIMGGLLSGGIALLLGISQGRAAARVAAHA
jgi:glycosyltransferase 2 family protein